MAQAFRVVVIGGVAAGPKIAAKVSRLRPDAEITLVERGEHLSYAGCGLTYYISDVVREQKELMATAAGVVRDSAFFQNVKNVTVHNSTEALDVDRTSKRVHLKNLKDGREWWIDYDKLALATGARPVIPPIPGVELPNVFILKGVDAAERVKQFLARENPKEIVIVGGGLIGVEMAEALAMKGVHVTMIEMLPQILMPLDWEMAYQVQKHMASKGVEILTNTKVETLEGTEEVEAVVAGETRFPADAVVVAVGVRPEIKLAKEAGLEIGVTGAIRVDEHMRTSDPDIYAAGDCVEATHLVTGKPVYVPLGSTANKQGRVAAVNICGGGDRFPGILGSTICKVFDFTSGFTGLTERMARSLGYDVVTCLVPGADRAHYYPGAKTIMLKMVANRATGRLLGVQGVGRGEASKRLDIAATAITAGMTVDQVSKLDLCYAPPYSGAMDIIITAADVLKNKIEGHMYGISPMELKRRMDEGEETVVLDVRTPAEYQRAHIKDAAHIPLGALRTRTGELPREKTIVVYCRTSLRAYEGSLILRNAGFDRVQVLDGSVTMWPFEMVE